MADAKQNPVSFFNRKRMIRLGFAGLYAVVSAAGMASARSEPSDAGVAATIYPAVYSFETLAGAGGEDGAHAHEFAVYFMPDSAQLTPAADRFVREVAQMARTGAQTTPTGDIPYAVRITSYVEPGAGFDGDARELDLARDRAAAIVDALISAGVPRTLVGARVRPAFETDAAAAFPASRRARIEVLSRSPVLSFASAGE